MCYPPTARPPDVPRDLIAISGGAGGRDEILTSQDGTRFRSYVAPAAGGTAGIVIAPDVRGLHPFYEELAERFASAGVHAIAFDYFGRTAGTDRRPDDFDHAPHNQLNTPAQIQADLAAAATHLRGATKARSVFVTGFCKGGRIAFNASAEQPGLGGVIGFYGWPAPRSGDDPTAPINNVSRMRAPVLGLFGGADKGIPQEAVDGFDKALSEQRVPHHIYTYPGAPHSFFDRTFDQYKSECDDAWRRVLGFIRTGDPASKA
ncbi:MAG: dienelactone hydrolase family protein [Chloroflexi bacterium]|nr:dienelactone hydrolase family protein [Chloroflexota bacterium]